jgi:hypothetical protein
MPARNAGFRALRDDFRTLLDQRTAWPLVKWFPAALADKGGGRKLDIFQMKAGAVVPEKLVRALVELIWDDPALADYLAAHGLTEHRRMTVQQVANLVAGPVLPHASPAPNATDWFAQGLDGLASLFGDFVWGRLVRAGTLCDNEEDVRKAVAMILASAGRQFHGGNGHLPAGEAIRIAERRWGITQNAYLGRVVGLWRKVPWTVAFAVADRQRIACSLVLPLKEPVYEEIRDGRRSATSCSDRDLAFPSRTLLLEALGQRTDLEYPCLSKKTAHALRSIMVHLAQLSLDEDCSLYHAAPSPRILSVAGSCEHATHLRKLGFRTTGSRMPGFAGNVYELHERKGWLLYPVIHKLQERLLETSGSAERWRHPPPA